MAWVIYFVNFLGISNRLVGICSMRMRLLYIGVNSSENFALILSLPVVI